MKTLIIRGGFFSLLPILLIVSISSGSEPGRIARPAERTDARPPVEWATHRIGNIGMAISNIGMWGDPWGDSLSLEWPSESLNNYLWAGDLWSCCYGEITAAVSAARYASCTAYGNWEFSPSEGYPLIYETPGSNAPEQSEYGIDDWDAGNNQYPYGLGVFIQNYTWDTPGFDNFLATELTVTHHSEHGNPGVPLDGLVVAIRGDCDIATADTNHCYLDDMVYYDGHSIWCNDPDATFEYEFDNGEDASTQDYYEYRQNPDNPLPPDDPDNIFYHYNYIGVDGIPDNDVDQNGVSDHFTILAKVVASDTLYREDPASGVILFSEGMPFYHFSHTVGDTTYLVVPRNLSYMWDSDSPVTTEDDSGEPLLPVMCNGFVGWRLLDVWVEKAAGGIERPSDVYGYPIPISHQWWNWESDPKTDSEKYSFMWGKNPDLNGLYSGPAYMPDWVGNPNAPDATMPQNPGPFPFVYDSPIRLGYPVFDYRFLQSVGPLELADGDTLHILGGWVAGRGLDGLRMNADLLLDAYYRDSIWGQGLGVESTEPVPVHDILVSPNPMTSQGVVNFTLAEQGRTVITIYDISGRSVVTILNSEMSAGNHSVNLNTSGMSSGVYFVRVLSEGNSAVGRFVVLNR
ncbi:MAG: T9SS type A sorting domain-containing protein [Candidatus Aegiribacteria sp.]|nr:T9SS type A sorting domain-containing protein [Candidatus Aegiribacteria sp.]